MTTDDEIRDQARSHIETLSDCNAEAGYCKCVLLKGHFVDHQCRDCGQWPTAALELDYLRHDYNSAVANGLIIKARSINRAIAALENPRQVDPWANRPTSFTGWSAWSAVEVKP